MSVKVFPSMRQLSLVMTLVRYSAVFLLSMLLVKLNVYEVFALDGKEK